MTENTSLDGNPFKEIMALMRVPPGTRDTNHIAKLLLPLAEKKAQAKAREYSGGRYATAIDKDACFSAALEGVREFSKKNLAEDTTLGSLYNMCQKIIDCRLHDLERTVIGRRKIRPPSHSFLSDSSGELIPDSTSDGGIRSVDLADAKVALLGRLEKMLSRARYKVVSAKINDPEKSNVELARGLEMQYPTFNRTLTDARNYLKKHAPSFEKNLAEFLNGHHRENGIVRF
ncbi:MAG: hypothetical protein KGI29_07465 [Pseudomonadota bacterium]|nr:hypothetical protein [Pseudomonadota bacterium]